MDRPLTIALANSGRRWIGEVAHVALLYEELEALGHRPWILCRRGWALEAHARRLGWRCLPLTYNSRFHPLHDPRDIRRWLAWARTERADLLHCHRGKDHWLGCAVARLAGLPLVRTRHVVTPLSHHPFNAWLNLRATDAILCVSHAARASYGSWSDRLPAGGPVIHSAVRIERFGARLRSEAWRREQAAAPYRAGRAGRTEAATEAATGRGEPLWFGLIGRFQRIKGQEVFLEAAARVARQCPSAHFFLAGRGGNLSAGRRCLERARALGIGDRLRVAGLLDDLPGVLASLDVGVIASLGSEGSSRIALEMMASGLPVAATRVGGIPELVREGETARLVAPGDPAALAEAMLAWAGEGSEARRRAGEAGRRHVEQHHQPRAWAEAIVQVYHNVLDR